MRKFSAPASGNWFKSKLAELVVKTEVPTVVEVSRFELKVQLFNRKFRKISVAAATLMMLENSSLVIMIIYAAICRKRFHPLRKFPC